MGFFKRLFRRQTALDKRKIPPELEKLKITLDEATGYRIGRMPYSFSHLSDATFLGFARELFSTEEILELTRDHILGAGKAQGHGVDFSIDEVLEALNKRLRRTPGFRAGRCVPETGQYECRHCRVRSAWKHSLNEQRDPIQRFIDGGAYEASERLKAAKVEGSLNATGTVRDFRNGENFTECPECEERTEWRLMSKPVLAKDSPGKIHGIFDIAKLTELASGRRCLVCGGVMHISGSGYALRCSAGHEELAFFAFDNSYCTQSAKIAEALASKGCRVVKAEDREQWSIFVE